MKWSVRLYGDSKLLKELEHCLKSDEVMVKYKEKNYYLYSKYFNELEDDREVFKVASKLVILINGAIKFFLNSDKMINFNAINSVDENGISKSIVFISGSAHIKTSTKGTLQGGKIKGINKITRWIQKGYIDKRIKILSELLNTTSNRWFILYNILELVMKDLSGYKELYEKNWVEKEKIESFFKTVENYDAIGAEARHVKGDKKIYNPMEYREAQKLIRRVNAKWIDEILKE